MTNIVEINDRIEAERGWLKKCRVCNIESNDPDELHDIFVKKNGCRYGYDNICRECRKATRNTKREKDLELKRKYGISLDDYENMLSEQNGSCKICNSSSSKHSGRGLLVDHCHDTGQVRGLLCHNCNTLLGHSNDSKQILLNAISYLGGFTAEEIAQQEKDAKIQEAKQYLASTDFKMTADYDQDTTEVRALRQEARELIRSLQGE